MPIVPVKDAINTHGDIAALTEVRDGSIHVPRAWRGAQYLLVQCVRPTALHPRVIQQAKELKVYLEVIMCGVL